MTASNRCAKAVTAAVVILLGIGAGMLFWFGPDYFIGWYYAHRLASADPRQIAPLAEKLAELDKRGVPWLLKGLAGSDPRACANSQVALFHVLESLKPESDRGCQLLNRLAETFARFSGLGQEKTVELAVRLVQRLPAGVQPTAALVAPLCRLIRESAAAGGGARPLAVDLAGELLVRSSSEELQEPAMALVRASLGDPEPGLRVRAIRLAGLPAFHGSGLVLAALHDPAPEVRRAALLTVGNCPDVIATDELLPWLHDPDREVRNICEVALRGRGLRDEYMEIARLLSDPDPKNRLRVLAQLRSHPELAPSTWLRKLSHDPDPAVRAAAVRAGATQRDADLADRLEEMGRHDPSATVRQLATYYGASRKPGSPRP